MKKYKITVEFLEPLLGTVPKDKDVYASYIAKKSTNGDAADELATVPDVEETGWTGFHTLDDGTPILYDYVVKGFFKDACGALRRASGTASSKLTSYKKVIDGLVFAAPRQIKLIVPGELGVIERPLRAQTAQGERVALARSDTAPAGTMMEFELTIIGAVSKTLLVEWLDYGALKGFGQWRNAGYGKFTYSMEEV